jgi:ATP sulfurylase
VTGGFIINKSSVSSLDSSFKKELQEYTLFTGNEWVRDICEKQGIKTEWIEYDIDISGTRIRQMIRKGENVLKWTVL